MVITLLHPSRGRPEKSFKNAMNWIHSAGCETQLIVSLDVDDPTIGEYIHEYRDLIKQENADEDDSHFALISGQNNSVVGATNRAAMAAEGDILLYLSDDFKCPDNWGQLIIDQFKGVTTPMLLKVDDCLQNFGARVLTIPIMNRQLYEKLGYFWHPGYKSMFVDEDLYNTAEKLRALKFAPQLKFPHEHVCNGKAPDDETYRRSSANWNQGQEFFKQRKAAGFPL